MGGEVSKEHEQDGVTGVQSTGEVTPVDKTPGFFGVLGEMLTFKKTSSNDEQNGKVGTVPQGGGRRICRRNRKNKRLTRRSPMRSKSQKRQSLRNK